jgi:hypothetical protein
MLSFLIPNGWDVIFLTEHSYRECIISLFLAIGTVFGGVMINMHRFFAMMLHYFRGLIPI